MEGEILPFYAVCDESGSMAGAPVQAINDALPELHREIGSDPVVCDKTRFALIGFESKAEVLMGLSDLSMVQAIPGLAPKGATSYGAAFDLLRTTIDADMHTLTSDGYQVYRPAVFFMSDGQPTDNWEAAYQRLQDPDWPYRPNIIAFGVAGADAATISKVGTVAAFVADTGVNPAIALKEYIRSLTNSIVSSTSSPTPSLMIPPPPQGFISVPLDKVS